MYESMNYSTFLLLLSILIGVKTQNNQDIQLSNNQNQVNYSNWIINTLNNTSSDILWKNGLWQMYKYFKPITNFDKRWEPKFITFNAQDSTMTVTLFSVNIDSATKSANKHSKFSSIFCSFCFGGSSSLGSMSYLR